MGTAMLEIDGSFGEGGGQILRTSLALSLLTGRAFHLSNIRAGRQRPGLRPQHLMSVKAAAQVGGAATRAAARGSTELVFEPGPIRPGHYRFDIGTAGATSLVLHTVYLPLALRGDVPSELTLVGGTHNDKSPCFHFLDVTWRRYMQLCGIQVRLRMQRPGFYPRGGGVVEAAIQPCPGARGLYLVERTAPRATGFSAVAGLDVSIGRRQARRARTRLADRGLQADIAEETWEGGPGTVLAVVLQTEPVPTLFFGLGARGKPAERVADEAVDQVLAYLCAATGPVDPHSADQLVLPLALAEGPSEYAVSEVTLHLTTNVAIIRRFVERDVACKGELGGPGRIRIR
jgi:RNA 3'-terminal phosphate cyclase (ATP)